MGKRGRETNQGRKRETGRKVPKIHSEGRAGGVVKEREALHPFEHDPADDCETCFQAYQDIWWVLTLSVT